MASTSFRLNVYPSGRIAQVIRPQVDRNMRPRVERVASAARSLAPKRTGLLSRSIRVRGRAAGGTFASLGGGAPICQYEIVVAVPYAAFVSKGTRPHIIRSKGPWPLRNRATGQVFGPVVRHPGTRPNDYLERALRVGFLRGG